MLFPSVGWHTLVRKACATPRKYQILAGVAAFVVFSLQMRFFHFHDPRLLLYDISKAAQNETLGFEKIFFLSLPSRTDRQDAMMLLGTTSNLTLTYQPGILGNTMNEKAKTSDGGFLRDEQWGSWRGHANVWKKVIDEKLETALILEDDVDWDVKVHDIFEELSRQLRRGDLRQTRMTQQELVSAPYGFDWDVLYAGTCYNIPRDPHPRHLTYKDPNAPGRADLSDTYRAELEGWGIQVKNETHKRVLAPSWYPICTIGYAVTQRGAQRLLYNIGGVRPFGSALDLSMTDRIKKGFLRAYTVIPPLITTWKTGGVRDTDIDDMKEKEKELKEGEKLEVGSKNLRSSAREQLNMLLGNRYPGNWELKH